MSRDVVLKLHDFEFQPFEVPEKIIAGGLQSLVIHRLPGGRRVIDAMGRDDADLSWQGLLYGPRALDRAHYLDGLRVRGEALELTWADFRYQVVVAEFTFTYERWWQIPYTMRCTVVSDESGIVSTLPPGLTISKEALAADAEAAAELAEEVDDGVLSEIMETVGGAIDAAMGAIDSVISTVAEVAAKAQEIIAAVVEPIMAAQQRVTLLISTVGNTVANITTLGGLLPNNALSEGAARLTSRALGVTKLDNLINLDAHLGRLGTGFQQIAGVGTSVKTVVKAGGDLFEMAGGIWNDATAWASLAAANDLTDPMIEGVVEVKVPLRPAANAK